MIKNIVEKRIDFLLKKVESVAEEMAAYQLEKESSESVIQKAQAGVIPPNLMKRFRSIQNELLLIKILFGGD